MTLQQEWPYKLSSYKRVEHLIVIDIGTALVETLCAALFPEKTFIFNHIFYFFLHTADTSNSNLWMKTPFNQVIRNQLMLQNLHLSEQRGETRTPTTPLTNTLINI